MKKSDKEKGGIILWLASEIIVILTIVGLIKKNIDDKEEK